MKTAASKKPPHGIVRVRRRPNEWDVSDSAAALDMPTPSVSVTMIGAADSSLSCVLSALLTPSRTLVAMKSSRDDPLLLIPVKPHPAATTTASRRWDEGNEEGDAPPPAHHYGLPAFQLLCNLEITPSTSDNDMEPTPSSAAVLIADMPSLPSTLQRALQSKRRGAGGRVGASCALHGPFGCHCVVLKSIGRAVCALRAEFRLPSPEEGTPGTPRFTGYYVPPSSTPLVHSEVATMIANGFVVPSVAFTDQILEIAAGCPTAGYGGTVLFFAATKPSSVAALVVVGCSAELPLPSTRRLLGPFNLGPNEGQDHVLCSLNFTQGNPTIAKDGEGSDEVVDDVPLKVPQCVACSARGVVSLLQCVGCSEYVCCPSPPTVLSSYPSDYQPTPAKQHKIPSAWIRVTPPTSLEAAAPLPPTPSSASCARQCLYCQSGTLCCQRCVGVEYSTAHYQRVYVCNQVGCRAQHREMERLAEFNQ